MWSQRIFDLVVIDKKEIYKSNKKRFKTYIEIDNIVQFGYCCIVAKKSAN